MMKLSKTALLIATALGAIASTAGADALPAAAYAPGVSLVPDAFSLLFLPAVLLPTAGCIVALLWLIGSDLRKARRSAPTQAKGEYRPAGQGIPLQPKIVA